jgi:hypothetical protein
MKNEIDKAHYCGGDKIECEYEDGPCSGSDCGYHPTNGRHPNSIRPSTARSGRNTERCIHANSMIWTGT